MRRLSEEFIENQILPDLRQYEEIANERETIQKLYQKQLILEKSKSNGPPGQTIVIDPNSPFAKKMAVAEKKLKLMEIEGAFLY